jgi:hypothetical protein
MSSGQPLEKRRAALPGRGLSSDRRCARRARRRSKSLHQFVWKGSSVAIRRDRAFSCRVWPTTRDGAATKIGDSAGFLSVGSEQIIPRHAVSTGNLNRSRRPRDRSGDAQFVLVPHHRGPWLANFSLTFPSYPKCGSQKSMTPEVLVIA